MNLDQLISIEGILRDYTRSFIGFYLQAGDFKVRCIHKKMTHENIFIHLFLSMFDKKLKFSSNQQYYQFFVAKPAVVMFSEIILNSFL